MALNSFNLLGRSGLRVSPACLGTMTFGTEWGWGSAEDTARTIFNQFLDAGGNFVDTANGYTGGTSEKLIGKFLKERGSRDKVVLATKFGFSEGTGDPNDGGNGRKAIMTAIEGSLRRLQTDYVDLYWMHNWDRCTPVEEVLSTLNDLVHQGKIRYIGLSNAPAWYLARAQTLAELRGWERFCGLQLEYSLLERNIEREHLPAAAELGAGLCPWSPLAGGILSGKYRKERGSERPEGTGRMEIAKDSGNPAFLKLFTERNWRIVDELSQVAKEIGRPMAQIALSWVASRPGVTSVIIGASKPQQLADNLSALELELPGEVRQRLDEISKPETLYPFHFFEPAMQKMVSGGAEIRRVAA